MIRFNTKFLLVLCLLLMASAAFSASPEADFKKLEKEYTLHPDGSMEYRCRKELKLNTHLAFNSLYGETFIVYDPQYQSIRFHSAYTRQADGTVVKVPGNAFNEVLPRAAAHAPAYNRLKEMVVTHTGLEIGATIYLDYSVLTQPGYYPELDINDYLQELCPVKSYTVTITVPANKSLAYTLSGSKVKPVITKQAGSVKYCWSLKNIPAASKEPFQPDDNASRPQLSATTYASPEAAFGAFSRKFDGTLPDAWKEFAGKLVQSQSTDKEKIEALQAYVANRIATTPVPLIFTGYKFRPAGEVLQSAYGTPAEKTNLLIGLLKAAGYTPHLLIACSPVHTNGLETIRELGVECNSEKLSATCSGVPAMIERGEADRIFLVSSDNKLTPFSSDYKEKIECILADSLTQQEAAIAEANGYVAKTIAVSSPKGVTNWHMNALNSTRTQALQLPRLQEEVYTLTFTVPEGVSVETPDSQIRMDKPFGSLEITAETDGQVIHIYRKLNLTRQCIQPEDYQEFRTFIHTWCNPNHNQLLFKKK